MWAFCLFVGSMLGRRTMGISTLEVGLLGTEMLAFAHPLSLPCMLLLHGLCGNPHPALVFFKAKERLPIIWLVPMKLYIGWGRNQSNF